MTRLVASVYICLVVCLVAPSFASASNSCGTVYDGLTDGKFDMHFQSSQNTIGANWFGFGDNVLSYEWAVFSQSSLSSIDTSSCSSQLRVIPDIQSWKSVNKKTSGISSNVNLEIDQTYHVALRTTFRDGQQLIAFSNGVQVREPTLQDIILEEPESAEIRSDSACSLSSCPIDEANRCAAGQVSVADKLRELYGEPVFLLGSATGSFIIDVDDDDDDGDDDDIGDATHVWIFAPIVIGILLILCCLILLLLLCLLCFSKASFSLPERQPREKKPPVAAPLDFDEVEESKGYGQRENAEAGDVATATVVEFPDTNIRRLSISHRDEAAAAVEDEPKRGRPAHPIMSSASSSFRDYRSSVNH